MTTIAYLSDAWLAEADRLIGTISSRSNLVVGVRVVDGPLGDRSYRLVFGPGRARIVTEGDGGHEAAAVRMTMRYPVAVSVASGDRSAQRAFLDGDIRLGGDAALLLGDPAVKALADLDDCFAPLRSRTDY